MTERHAVDRQPAPDRRVFRAISRRTWLIANSTMVWGATTGSLSLAPGVFGRSPAVGNDPAATAASGWWTWRGPLGSNVAAAAEFASGAISPERIVWRAAVPGRGHSSPIVTDAAVYLTTADTVAGTQSVLAWDRSSGSPLWHEVVHQGGLPKENHRKNTEATPTVAFDGRRLLVAFYNSDAIWVTAHGLDGKRLWQRSVGRYTPTRYKYGYAASPTIYGDLAIVSGESDGPAFLAAISVETGETVWRSARPELTSFSSPIVARVAGRDQVLLSGALKITSHDPSTGDLLWEAPGPAMATCGTVVWDDRNVFASGGFPQSETTCVRADGSGEVVWKNNQKCYEQSMLCAGGHLYAVTDQGVAYCWRADDGTLMWRERLGGNYSSSPILVGDVISIFNEAGQAFSFKATPDRYERIGEGQLGSEAFASPAVVGDTMYMRIAEHEPQGRQEYLLALR
ncbi:MAG: dehydrogenase [Planctomycetaceae bacterium]|nr:MAG: dehydrogenase [Planctomycetaceae bacterium]